MNYALMISIEFSFHLGFSLISLLRYQFPAFLREAFLGDEYPPAETFPEQLSNLII